MTLLLQPGESGNPKGKTSEQKRNEMRAAELATKLRLAALEAQWRQVESNPGSSPEVTTGNLRMWKDAEDRGLGAPVNRLEHRSVTELSDEELEAELDVLEARRATAKAKTQPMGRSN